MGPKLFLEPEFRSEIQDRQDSLFTLYVKIPAMDVQDLMANGVAHPDILIILDGEG